MINLFGLQLSHEPNPQLQPMAGVEEKSWHATLNGDDLNLEIQLVINGRYYLRLAGDFVLCQLSPDVWGFKSGKNGVFGFTDGIGPQTNNFELIAGWVNARSRDVKFNIMDNGYLGVDVPLNRFIYNRQLPIQLRTTKTAALTLVLNETRGPRMSEFTAPCIWFAPESFEASTHVGALTGGRVRLLYKQIWQVSDAKTIPLTDLENWHNLRFTRLSNNDQADGFLPLHAFRWSSGEVSPSLSVATDNLNLELGLWNDNHILKAIKIEEGIIRTYVFHDTEYNPVDWNFSSQSQPMELVIQPVTAGAELSSFLLKPGHSLTCEQSNSGKILGQRAGVKYAFDPEATGQHKANLYVPIDDAYLGSVIPYVDKSLLHRATGPVLKPLIPMDIEYAKAGNAYKYGDVLDTWKLRGENGVLALLPDEGSAINPRFQGRYHNFVNSSLSSYQDEVRETVHESRHVMGAQTQGNVVKLDQFLSSVQSPSLSEYETDYGFGYVTFRHTWFSSEITDYFVVFNDGSSSLDITNTFALDPITPLTQTVSVSTKQPRGIASNDGRKIIALVKLARGRDLRTLLKSSNADQKEVDALLSLIPEELKRESWNGCLLFNQPVNLDSFPLLKSLVGEGGTTFELKYLAISASSDDNDKEKFSTYGRVQYTNNTKISPHPGKDHKLSEVLMQTRKVDIIWTDRNLTAFHTEVDVLVRTFMGYGTDDGSDEPKPSIIKILGSIDTKTNSIRFLARSKQPIPLLPEGGIGPVKQLFASRFEIARVSGENKVDVDGDIVFQSLDIDSESWFDSNGEAVRFKGFGFRFPDLKASGSWTKFDYPSFQFVVGNGGYDLLSFPFIKVRLKGLGVDFPDSGFDWGSLIEWKPGWNTNWSDVPYEIAARFRLGFEMSRLPLLNAKPFESLNFDFELGIPLSGACKFDISKLRVHVGAVGFNKLELDLVRFLTIRAQSISFEAKEISSVKVPWFNFEGVEVDILEKNIINNLTFHYFSVPAVDGRNGEKGFLGIIDPSEDVDLFLIQIEWVLMGQNLSIPADVARAIISIKSDWSSNLKDEIKDAYDKNQLIPLSLKDKENLGDWIFAAGLKVLYGVLSGKFLFQDNAYYGIALEGRLFEEWFGWEFAIAALYIQRERPEEDSFYIEIRVPLVSFGAIAMKGGVIAIEIQMNGGFMLDIGFPWLTQNGVRDWDRAQGMFISGLMGKGGSYIAKRTAVRVIRDEQNRALLMLAAGQAGMVGIGGAYSNGPFRVEAYAGVYFVAEGAIVLRNLDPVGLRLVGAVGIQVRGVGELNWWIISIRVEVIIGAEARLTLNWGISFDPRTGIIGNPNARNPIEPVTVQLDFILYARVSARASIGKGWFKISKGISIGVSMPYRNKLRLGG